MQVSNGTDCEVTPPTLATMPASPGAFAVASPFASTPTTLPLELVQLNWPMELVMSVVLCNALAVNCCVLPCDTQLVPAGSGAGVT
jgi:hypothetical protein